MRPDLRLRPSAYTLLAGLAIVLAVALATWTLAGCSGSRPVQSASPTNRPPARSTTATARPPNHDGPFAVGKRTATFVDSSRPTPANGTVPGAPTRTLATIIEYPAPGAPDAGTEVADAAPVAGRFPLVVYVHGFGAHADDPYLHAWAAAGFVAVAPTFPLTNADTPGGPNQADAVNVPGDVSFVISNMLNLPARDADLQRIIDPAGVGVMGTSLGATTVMDLGYDTRYHDPRIKAVVAVAGGCTVCPPGITDPSGTYFTGPAVPLMLIHGTADPFAPYQHSVQEFARAPSPKFLLTLRGAKHIQFGPPWEPIAQRSTVDFFRCYLEHSTTALRQLAIDADVPGTADLRHSP